MSDGDAAELLSDELDAFCASDSFSEEGLREIIERFGLPTQNNGYFYCNGYNFMLDVCDNESVTEDMIRLLIEYFPNAPDLAYCGDGRTPLHWACMNKNMTANIIQLLIEAAPDSVRREDYGSNLAIHCLCFSDGNDQVKLKILKLLLDANPESSRHANSRNTLPLHLAASKRSLEFCRMLVESYPDSVQVVSGEGLLPLHFACARNTLPTVEYLYNLYPDAINHATPGGCYPIHFAVSENVARGKRSKTESVDVVKFLLQLPGVKVLIRYLRRVSLLSFACNHSTIEAAGVQIIEAIYDAYPEAIEDDIMTSNVHQWREEIQAFINGEMFYARQAANHDLMTTPDEHGQLPLHRALRNNVRLGSMKLLLNGNRCAAGVADHNGSLPLQLACQHHDSPCVIEHLIDFCPTTLRHDDFERNTALHYACRGAKYGTIVMLLDKYNPALVSMTNVHNQLPIDMLFESISVADRESVEYTDCVFRLLRSYPETMAMNVGVYNTGEARSSFAEEE